VKSIVSASASWWILFVLVRQVITFTMAYVTGLFIVDYLAMRTRMFVRLFGPLVTLVIVQSKGWPITALFWGVYDFILLFGRHDYVKHWYVQGLFMPILW